MDEDIAIINSATRIEKVKNFIINYKKKIIIFLSIIILSILIFFVYEEIQKKNKEKLATKYNYLIINFISDNKINIENAMIEIIHSKDKTYSPLALYFLIDNNIVNSNEKINTLFDILIYETNLTTEIKNLIIYKKGLFNSNFATENNLLKILNPLINSESVWKSHALYLMAEYFLSKNERQKSKEFFEKIVSLNNSNPNILSESKKKIQREFSE